MRTRPVHRCPNPPFRAIAIIALTMLSACSPPAPAAVGDPGTDSRPRASAGVTVFGDARLGVAID